MIFSAIDAYNTAANVSHTHMITKLIMNSIEAKALEGEYTCEIETLSQQPDPLHTSFRILPSTLFSVLEMDYQTFISYLKYFKHYGYDIAIYPYPKPTTNQQGDRVYIYSHVISWRINPIHRNT